MPTPTIAPTKVRPLSQYYTDTLGNIANHELVNSRSWNYKVFDNLDGTLRCISSVGWQHYLGADGHWGDIDTNYVPVDGGWEVVDAPFFLKVPQFADGEAYFEANVRFDVFEKKEILDAPIGMFLRAATASHVQGELFDMDGNGRTDAIIYRNAYPQWNADLIYYARHGRVPRLEKLVRFNLNPAVVGILEIPFDVRYTEAVDIEVDNTDALSAKNYVQIKNAISKAIIQEKLAVSSSDASHKIRAIRQWKTAMRMRRRSVEANEKTISTNQSLAIYKHGSASDMRGIGMRDFRIWDSADNILTKKKVARIDVQYSKITDTDFRLTKKIDATFFNQDVIYPVYTDASSTFYPDPDVESSSVDGYISYAPGAGTGWSTVRGASTGSSADDSSTTIAIQSSESGEGTSQYTISRGSFGFDMSGVSGQVTGASLALYVTISEYNDNDAQAYINIVGSSPASDTALAVGDYDGFDTTKQSDDDKTLVGFTTSAYATWTFNATGVSNVILGNVVHFGAREGHDLENLSVADNSADRLTISSADASGTTQDPKLDVTYTPAPTTPTNVAVVAQDGSQNLTVSWDDVADETSYSIERSDDGATGWTEVATPAADETSWIDTTISAWSTQKYYRMRSYNSGTTLYSSYSSTVNATTSPQAPSGLAVAAESDSENLNLTWTENASDETGIEVQASDDGATGWSTITTEVANAVSYTHNVTTRDTLKYYRIRAVRSGDSINSDWSSIANATTAPADPTSIVLTPSSGQIEVAWTDNSSTETTFSIERKPSGGAYSVLTTDTASPYADTSGTDGTTYFYKLRAYRASDGVYSGYAAEQSSTVPPTAPTNLLASCTDDTPAASKVQLTWQHTSQNETGTKIERKLGAGAYSTITTTAGGVSSYEDTGLTENSEYTYRISATAGGVFSSTIEATVTTLLGISSSLRHTFYRKINHLPY